MEINQERERFEWFADRPEGASDPAVTADDLLAMVKIRRKMTPEIMDQLKYRLFPLVPLIHPNEFRRLVEAEQRAGCANKEAQDGRNYPGYVQLSALDRKKRDAVKVILEGILATQDSLSKHFHSWAKRTPANVQEIRIASGDKSSRQPSSTSSTLNTCLTSMALWT